MRHTGRLAITMATLVILGGALSDGPAHAQGERVSGPNSGFTLVLPDGWRVVAHDGAAEGPGGESILRALSLPGRVREESGILRWAHTFGVAPRQ